MNRFGVKLILSIVSFLAVNIWLIGKGVAKGAADFFISATVEETILFIIITAISCTDIFYISSYGKKI